MKQSQPQANRSGSRNGWFEVDKQGLAKILERKGKEFGLLELIQNAWDEPGVTSVTATLEYRGRGRAVLVVEDDAPEGFKDLSHAFTLFAESAKKSNPEQRGRFNLGEKLVLALCDEVTIQTTKGGLRFEGRSRHMLRSKRTAGSRIDCVIKMSDEECQSVEREIRKLLPPAGIATTFNGVRIEPRVPTDEFLATLRTEVAGEEGLLKRAERQTTVRLHEPKQGERAMLYEMGIPVVETGDKWHYDIGQKVPLTLDRENVLPAFLAQVRLAVFNRMHRILNAEDVNSEWAETAARSSGSSARIRFAGRCIAREQSPTLVGVPAPRSSPAAGNAVASRRVRWPFVPPRPSMPVPSSLSAPVPPPSSAAHVARTSRPASRIASGIS